ncbi:TIGR04255 family protein [Pseudomonas stutzeri]|uniref:TIGR04255 family protein n=1 Tax=Stutzerimonas stutzeri TaxID=316 RepID=UPI00210D7231|nr:TIGR04255 family protein [Stutzerimonas stutzeri]MCQ4282057.1 TIGR04255 family protein [Stutzerimonas stutzeri]
MTNRTGILAKTPLKYVLASVRFAPWPLVAKKMDEIQDELRDVLPLMHHIRIEVPEGQPQSAGMGQDAWMLADADKDYCVQFSKDQIIFFTKTYSHYKGFAERNSRALGVLYKYMKFIDVHNAGIRYIDHIKPHDNEKKSDYICDKFLPPAINDLSISGGHIISHYKSGSYDLRVNVLGIPGSFPIPQEMVSLPLILNGPDKPFQVEALGQEDFIADMDAITMYEHPKRLPKDELENVLNELHNVANKFFRHKDFFTEHAFNVWKGES